ncbi:hypothetical protein RI129_007235 [Pyrocoelia pectoralis]|uniref:NTF2 domain-containing protein n=1 Tax=Pyrocoelia pectoralis TaxID=417401 RepID=A0AAN7V7K7_9COLE
MSTNVSQIYMGPEAVILNEANVNSEILLKECKLVNNQNYWHKIIVQNCAYCTRDFILKTILDNIYPLDFIPVCYTTENQNASFFVRNCAKAIEKLCQQKLIVQNPKKWNQPFKLMIILAFSNTKELVVNVQENIAKVLTKKYNWNNKTLNLDSFHKDPDLREFCTLSQPKILKFVLHLSKQFQIQVLRLAKNDIHMLKSMEAIRAMKSLRLLDLGFNRIENISELNILKTMQITELHLGGNPLCDLYDENTYVQAVREVCPKIQKLDGILLGEKSFLSFRRNFLCDRDGHELVNQFLEHFFTFYDSPHRALLITLYHESAMFSLTCSYLVGEVSTSTSNLGVYKSMQRNIKVMSDLAKSEQCLMKGPKNICNLFTKLPITEHDPHNFTVDLVYYSEVTAIITVTGVFRESRESLLDAERYLGFARTFVLLKVVNNEFKIVNEQLHVSNATTSQQQRAFIMGKPNKQLSLQILKPTSDAEQDEMTNSFKLLTSLNSEWSKMYLEDCDYDFKKSLTLFVDLYKEDKIPEVAFAPIPETTNVSSPKKFKRKSHNRRHRDNQRRILIYTTENDFVRMPRKLAIAQGIISADYADTRLFLFNRGEDTL